MAGQEFPFDPPPGLLILVAGAIFVAVTPWRWSPTVGAGLGLFVIIGFLVSSFVSETGFDNITGDRYQWIIHEPLAPASSWLVELLTPERTVNGSKELKVSTSPAYGRAARRRELERLSQAVEGTRNPARSGDGIPRLRMSSLGRQRRPAAVIAQGARSSSQPGKSFRGLGCDLHAAYRGIVAGGRGSACS